MQKKPIAILMSLLLLQLLMIQTLHKKIMISPINTELQTVSEDGKELIGSAIENPPTVYPIIFLPGFGGSQLVRKTDPKYSLWLSYGQIVSSYSPKSDLLDLRLNPDGTDPETQNLIDPQNQAAVGDVLQNVGFNDVYGNFLEYLQCLGYFKDKDKYLTVFPYDFRKNPKDNADKLNKVVDEVLRTTRRDKVILIGHSLGGLIARTYVVNTQGKKVKAMITIGTPWLGTALVTQAMKQGWDFGLPSFGFLHTFNPEITEKIIPNWPGAMALTPGRDYFKAYSNGFQSEQLEVERQINSLLYDQVQAWRQTIFNGEDYGVENYIIVGDKGPNSTLVHYFVNSSYPTEVLDRGDNSIPIKSALLGLNYPSQTDTLRATDYIGRWKGYIVNIQSQPKGHTDLPSLQGTKYIIQSILMHLYFQNIS